MKRVMATVLVLVLAFSFASIAMAADSPTIIPIEDVKVVEPEVVETMKKQVYSALEELKVVGEKEVAEEALAFTFEETEPKLIAFEIADVKPEDKIFVLFYAKDSKPEDLPVVIEAIVNDAGLVEFETMGEGDYLVVRVIPEDMADATKLIPKTGDNYRLAKLMLVGLAAIAVMTMAGVAIKRSNNA